MDAAEEQRLTARAEQGDTEAQEALALHLLGASEPASEPFFAGVRWLERAVDAGSPSALATLGNVHLQHPTLPDAPAMAVKCFSQGARAGDPFAVERLADLYLFGYGVDIDDEKACSLYRQLAEYGFPSVLCHAAYLTSEGIGCEADEGAAASYVLRAAAQGHTLAFFLAGHRYAGGLGVPEDQAIATAWMELAAARGFPSAEAVWQHWLDRLDDSSRHRARDLADRLKQNLRRLGTAIGSLRIEESHPEYPARFNQLVAENYANLGMRELALDASLRGLDVRRRTRPGFRPEVCSWKPRVLRVPDFATAEERGFLFDLAQPLLTPTADSQSAGRAVEIDAFDGDCAMFPPHVATPVMRTLARRFAALLQIRETHFEPMSVLRYGVGNEYSPHVDWFDGERMERHRLAGDLGGQRITTALIYLVEPDQGGETYYPASDTTVRGSAGTAVVHHNATPDGAGDPDSMHQGRPIREGEKWLLRTAVREASLYDSFYRDL